MLQKSPSTHKSSFQHDCAGLGPRAAFMTAMQKMQAAGKCTTAVSDIKALLHMAGLSQNGRNRIVHLSGEEINALCKHCPNDELQWHSYVSEVQGLLSKMDQARKADSTLGLCLPTHRIPRLSELGQAAHLRYPPSPN